MMDDERGGDGEVLLMMTDMLLGSLDLELGGESARAISLGLQMTSVSSPLNN